MKARIVVLTAMAVLAAADLMSPVQAQEGMDELLQQIRESGRAQKRINREREAEFLRRRNEQQALLRKARAERDAARQRAARVRAEFQQGQEEIDALKERLQEASSDLGRLFAAARTAAGDLRSAAERSPLTIQYPERLEALSAIADNPALPSLLQLEELWFLLMQDMTENGRVARFDAEISDILGNRRQARLMRIGEFSAFTEEGYVLLPEGGTVPQLLPRQPGGRFGRAAERLFDAEPGDVEPALVDVSRGRLLEVEAEKPGVLERIHQGGLVGYAILLIGFAGLVLAGVQLVYLTRTGHRVRAQLKEVNAPREDNPLGRVMLAVESVEAAGGRHDPELLELQLSEAVVKETPRLERFQPLLKLFVAVAPLMGLLGTVTGMILTFQAITLFGTGDPKLMAGGISQALVTTVLGLCVAVPLLFLNSLLAARSRRLVQTLDEESALLLAQHLEEGHA